MGAVEGGFWIHGVGECVDWEEDGEGAVGGACLSGGQQGRKEGKGVCVGMGDRFGGGRELGEAGGAV